MKTFLIHLRVAFFNLWQFCIALFRYYRNVKFCLVDLLLFFHALKKNPYALSCGYGETPLTTLDLIAKQCRILSKDVVYEMGSGRGRGAFWLHAFIGCHVVGIEKVEAFVKGAKKIQQMVGFKKMEFRHEEIQDACFHKATVVYLYGLYEERETLAIFQKKCEQLKPGSKIITASFPLEGESFRVEKTFPARFPWGLADIYVNCRQTPHAPRQVHFPASE